MATERSAPGPVSERIIFGVVPGAAPCGRAPVRIFVGSEAAQHRAERVLLWSIARARNPGRVYEIHLLRNLEGFRTRGWRTGFTNYRFAVPHLAGGVGRALYNDVDQVYLADPAELFDSELHGAGCAARSPHDTSVMLLDCVRTARMWTLRDAQRRSKAWLQRRAANEGGFFAELDRAWNARDSEFDEERTKCLHFTTLATQPWRPFPERFVYGESPAAHVFHDLERDADDRLYTVFGRDRPSTLFADWIANPPRDSGAASGLAERWGVTDLSTFDAGRPPMDRDADGISLCDTLDAAPADDLPWLLDEVAAGARRFIQVAVACGRPTIPLRSLGVPALHPRTPAWWIDRIEAAAARHPRLHWQLILRPPDGDRRVHEFGKRLSDASPRVWVLTDDRPGNTSQSLGLALRLGWPTEIKDLEFNPLATLHNRLLGASHIGVRGSRSSPLESPWPDLVIAAGRRNAPVAEWIRSHSGGRTRTVMLGRKAGDAADRCDLSAVPSYIGSSPHPRRMTTLAPLHPAGEEPSEALPQWKERFGNLPSPRIAVLIGGASGQYRLDAATASRLGNEVARHIRRTGGSLLATTSRRTGPAATAAFRAAVGNGGFIHAWNGDPADNPYSALLAFADEFVVTGDSESMLAEALATDRPVAIFSLPHRNSFRVLRVVRDWVTARARGGGESRRGVARPQQGLAYLAARLIDRGFVRPTRDLDRLHDDLIDRGLAHRVGDRPAPAEAMRETDATCVAERVRRIMGC